MEKINDQEIINFIKSTLNKCESFLDSSVTESVNHYLEHDEYEMAFEILFIDIISKNRSSEIDKQESRRVGIFLMLDKESIFDSEFWSKFEDFLKK